MLRFIELFRIIFRLKIKIKNEDRVLNQFEVISGLYHQDGRLVYQFYIF